MFQPSRIGSSSTDIPTYIEWDNWTRCTSGSSGSDEYVLANSVIGCITIEIMITDSLATVYPELQKPRKKMFEEDHEEDLQGDLQGDFELNLVELQEMPSMTQIPSNETDLTSDDPREESPDFFIENSPHNAGPSCSSQIQGHENASLFDSAISSIKSQSGSTEPDGEQMVTFKVDLEKYDYLFEPKNRWNKLTRFPTSFTAMVLNNEVVLDPRSINRTIPVLEFVRRKDLDIDGDAIPMRKKTDKNEKQQAKAAKAAKKGKKHARTNKREETLEFSEDTEYVLTDIPKSRQDLIYKEEHLRGPMKLLVEHHKAGGTIKSSDPDDDFLQQTIWPELQQTYRFAEIMKRPKNMKSARWESSRKPFLN